jgi:hypothetical protein
MLYWHRRHKNYFSDNEGVQLSAMDKNKYRLEKLANRKTGYPIVTIAYYGPNDEFSSKVSVGVLLTEEEKETANMRRWYSIDTDVRYDAKIIAEILDYIDTFKPRRVVMVDRIIGCPHEEGIDYPEGAVCPKCSFWANRDRWTGEIIR